MAHRQKVPNSVETKVLVAARRRCCICVFLYDQDKVCKGQIAHLNHDPSDIRFENLVWLCLEHHDEYDSTTSQSKGLKQAEVEAYRDELYARHPGTQKAILQGVIDDSSELPSLPPRSEFDEVRKRYAKSLSYTSSPWRYGLWQVANQPDLFAYKSPNGADGVCLIERIDLPDGRIVIACISVPGNPGMSITNAVEDICFQVCERFEIPPNRLVWLEHYDRDEEDEWDMVTFAKTPPRAPFGDPAWITMTPQLWATLGLKPKKRLVQHFGQYESKLKKLFPWPPSDDSPFDGE